MWQWTLNVNQTSAVSKLVTLHGWWNDPQEEKIKTKLDFSVHLAKTPGTSFMEHKARCKTKPSQRWSSEHCSRRQPRILGASQLCRWRLPGPSPISNLGLKRQSAPQPINKKCLWSSSLLWHNQHTTWNLKIWTKKGVSKEWPLRKPRENSPTPVHSTVKTESSQAGFLPKAAWCPRGNSAGSHEHSWPS